MAHNMCVSPTGTSLLHPESGCVSGDSRRISQTDTPRNQIEGTDSGRHHADHRRGGVTA